MRTHLTICVFVLLPSLQTALLAGERPHKRGTVLAPLSTGSVSAGPVEQGVRGDMTAAMPDTFASLAGGGPVRKAFLRSLLIPGWGQERIRARVSARNFLVAELALWTGLIAFQVNGNWLQDDYRLFGATHAGIDEQGKNSRFFADVGDYNSTADYNEAQLRRRDVSALYDPATHHWRWDSIENRRRYDELRRRSERAYVNSTLVIAGVLANHVISGVHAAYVARQRRQPHQRGVQPAPQFYVATSLHEFRLIASLNF